MNHIVINRFRTARNVLACIIIVSLSTFFICTDPVYENHYLANLGLIVAGIAAGIVALMLVIQFLLSKPWKKKAAKEIPQGAPIDHHNRAGEPFNEEDLPVTKIIRKKSVTETTTIGSTTALN